MEGGMWNVECGMWNVLLLHQHEVVSRTSITSSLAALHLRWLHSIQKATESCLSKRQFFTKISDDIMATVVLITGCSSGIGKYTALEYANNPKFKVSSQLVTFKIAIATAYDLVLCILLRSVLVLRASFLP